MTPQNVSIDVGTTDREPVKSGGEEEAQEHVPFPKIDLAYSDLNAEIWSTKLKYACSCTDIRMECIGSIVLFTR